MNVKYENCAMLDQSELVWCATDVNPDGTFNSFQFYYDLVKKTDRSLHR